MPDKILVVDDEVEIADLIEVYLNNENYSVFKFYSAKEALECINTTNLDLAILDVMLPDIDGYTLCQKIRTRHTYLSLLHEDPDMPAPQRVKHVRITLEKAYRLEKMINEFFEITRYNSQQIKLIKESIDLSYMLIQLSDELSPVFSQRGLSIKLEIDEDLTVCADADQLARVFSNILKNAAAYSYLNTEIRISTEKVRGHIFVIFQNKGNTIPAEKLSSLFDKFYRLDESRASDTGGTGLGLAIAKEIILLHGGTIHASSENDTVTFTVQLPAADSENIYPSSSFSQETNN